MSVQTLFLSFPPAFSRAILSAHDPGCEVLTFKDTFDMSAEVSIYE